MKTVRRLFCGVAAPLFLLVTGCAGSSSVGSSGSGDPIKLGVIGQFTGVAAPVTGVTPKVLDAWKRTVNAAGGINGHPVDLLVKDVGDQTGANMSAARSLITQDKVSGLIDLDAGDLVWVKYAAANNVPVVAASGFGYLLSPDVFPVFASPAADFYGYVAEAKRLGPKMATAYAAEYAGVGEQTVAIIKSFTKPLGVDLAVASKISAAAPDYTAFCQSLKDASVDSYQLSFTAPIVKKISDQCRQQGVDAKLLLDSGALPPSRLADPSIDGSPVLNSIAPFTDTSIPGVAEYRKALKQYVPSVPGSQYDTSVPLVAWAAAKMFETGAKAAKGTGAKDVRQGLYSLKDETLGGLIGPLTYSPDRTTSPLCWFTSKVSGGKLVPGPNGAKPTCAPAKLVAAQDAAMLKSLGG
ncbi:ABC transporter substrate-binding protein [Streptomyces sp. NPDC051985]|uniref:ABC transporter substrate-binding protein n=1 Tax=Streptomyces sp. NPDC051985 TaxID=3155807 RepID=UPI00341767FF